VLHLQAAPGPLHPAHHLLRGCALRVMPAFLFRLIFFQTVPHAGEERVVFTILHLPPSHCSFPQKRNKHILFAESFLLSVAAQLSCRPSSDFLLHLYKAQHYKLRSKPHGVHPYGPGSATADTTSTGCLMVSLAPALLLFQLSGSAWLCADIFCIPYLTKINRWNKK